MRQTRLLLLILFAAFTLPAAQAQMKSIQDFGVLPTNEASVNARNLQKAIDWATSRGATLYVEPAEITYPIDGGIILKKNVSLVGANGPTQRAPRHPEAKRPARRMFAIRETGKNRG